MKKFTQAINERKARQAKAAESRYPKHWKDESENHIQFRKELAKWVNEAMTNANFWTDKKANKECVDSFHQLLTSGYGGPIIIAGRDSPSLMDSKVVDNGEGAEYVLNLLRKDWGDIEDVINSGRITKSAYWRPHLIVEDWAYYINLRYPNARFSDKCHGKNIKEAEEEANKTEEESAE